MALLGARGLMINFTCIFKASKLPSSDTLKTLVKVIYTNWDILYILSTVKEIKGNLSCPVYILTGGEDIGDYINTKCTSTIITEYLHILKRSKHLL
jgi:hypothetical protein